MTSNVILNNVDHPDLRVAVRHGAAFGDAANQFAVFPAEFADAAREFPLFLRRDDAGDWVTVALTGLDRDQNLFFHGERWTTRHVPHVQRRGPFLIGRQAGAPVVLVDLDDPRVAPDGTAGDGAGERVFRDQGGNTPFLDRITDVLRALHEGVEAAPTLYGAWDRHGLIEPVALEIGLDDGSTYVVDGMHTIGRERLATLSGTALEELNRAGHLAPAFLVAASVSNVQHLIERKAAR